MQSKQKLGSQEVKYHADAVWCGVFTFALEGTALCSPPTVNGYVQDDTFVMVHYILFCNFYTSSISVLV